MVLGESGRSVLKKWESLNEFEDALSRAEASFKRRAKPKTKPPKTNTKAKKIKRKK
jgi:hypothetical protein